MTRFPKAVLSAAMALLVMALLIVAVSMTVLRLALPHAERMRPQVEDALTDLIGREVRVGAVGAGLAGFTPYLLVERLVLPSPDGEGFEPLVERLRITLDLWSSLRAAGPRVTEIELVGADLQVRRAPDGAVSVAGLEHYRPRDPGVGIFFLSEGRLRVKESRIRMIDEVGGSPIGRAELTGLELTLSNARETHGLALSATLSGFEPPVGADRVGRAGAESPVLALNLIARLGGSPREPAQWGGDVYLRVLSGDLGGLLPGVLPHGWTAMGGVVSLETWAELSDRTLVHAVGQVRVQDLAIGYTSPGSAVAALELEQMIGIWRWRPAARGTGGRIDVADLRLCLGGMRWPATDLSLRYAPRDAGFDLALDVGRVELVALLSSLVEPFMPLLPDALWTLTEQQPHGRLHRLGLRLSQREGEAPLWSVAADARGLGVAAVGRMPGLQGLDARLRFDASGGTAALSSSDLTLDMPGLFQHPLRLDDLAGRLRWRRRDDGLWLMSEGLCASTVGLSTRSRFRLQLPADGTSPFLNLSARFWDGDLASVQPLLPVRVLKPKLRGWLQHAVIDGQVPRGEARFLGRLADYPFDGELGHFEVRFDVDDGVLAYLPDWPRLEELQGRIGFVNRRMEADVRSARLLDTELTEGRVEIPNLFVDRVVKIDARGSGPFRDAVRILSETPLQTKLGRLASVFEVEGPARLHLRLGIPLPKPNEEKQPVAVWGELTWPGGAGLSIKGSPIALSDLGGAFVFTRDSLSAERVDARIWGVPVRLDLRTEASPDGRITRIGATGAIGVAELARRFPSPVWAKTDGTLPWRLAMDIRTADVQSEARPPIAYRLTSDLRGVALDLPAPLGKEPSQRRDLDLSGTLIVGRGLSARGRIGALNGGLTFAYDPGRRAMRLDEIEVPHLQLGSFLLRDLRIKSGGVQDAWVAEVETRDLEGVLTIPADTAVTPIRLHLYDVDLDGLLEPAAAVRAADSAAGPAADPHRAPLLDLRVDRLRWGANDLGSLTVRSRRGAGGVVFEELSLDSELVKVRGGAEWLSGPAGPRTSLRLDLDGSDMGAFLRRLEYQILLDRAPSKAKLELDWPGGPDRFSLEQVAGTLEFDIGAGSFLEVEPGVGRMLGILNVGALWRRLKLDFRDVLDEGYAFERIEGRLTVGQGQAEINRFEIDASSADIEATGRTNLVTRRFDQTVMVMPKLGSGVALASAMAGGPLVGAAVFVVDKVTGGAVDKLSRYRYRITGPWDDPTIESSGWDPSTAFIKSGGRAQSRKTAPEVREEAGSLFLE